MKISKILACWLLSGSVFAQTQHQISIKDFNFIPATINIEVGDSVRWTNAEKRQYHSVWFEQLGEAEPDYLFPEDSYEKTFDTAGDFPYRCGPHPKMLGVVHVLATTTATEIPESRRNALLFLLKHDCGSCHGMRLKGGLGPPLLPQTLGSKTPEQLVATILYGRTDTPMPPWQAFLTEPEAQWLVAMLRKGLSDEN